jgi:NAD(P)-dependent dehydrogenase (short-subunit alcohol dehydrogenase family)
LIESTMGRLDGKVAVVTGAAAQGPGIGNGTAAAMLFAREGARVVLVNRDVERAEHLADQIRGDGGEALAFAADVTRWNDAEAMAEFAITRFGRLDVLLNNVGAGVIGTVESVPLDDWQRGLDVNLTSAMLCSRACLPRMRSGGGGSIIMISSIAGALGMVGAGAASYAAAKAGIHGLTRSVAADYADQHIRANCIIVGSVHTPMSAVLGDGARARRANMVPLRSEGTAWDVAYGALYLASDESRWVTGILLPIDGGLLSLREWPH